MKEAIINHQIGKSEEDFIIKLEVNNNLRSNTLIFYFNHLMMINMNNNVYPEQHDFKKINRKWTKNEIEFMFQYILARQEEGVLNITEILDEIAHLLNRGYQSVNYKYYSLCKARENKATAKEHPYHFTTITEKDVPVLSTEIISELPSSTLMSQMNHTQDDHLLDILSGLITNVQQLPGLNLTELLKSLYQLTNMAVQNQAVANQIETMKSEVHLEKEALREKLMKKEQQLLQEKKRNDALQLEVLKLAKEIAAFNKLGDAAKIQNLKSYNQRLNYIIDESGVVLQVGS